MGIITGIIMGIIMGTNMEMSKKTWVSIMIEDENSIKNLGGPAIMKNLKKISAKALMLLCAIALVLSVTSCGSGTAQETTTMETTTTAATTTAPTTTTTAPTTTSVAPTTEASTPGTQDLGLLELNEFYYAYGDPTDLGLMFFDDGFVRSNNFDIDGIEASFTVDGGTITLTYMGQVSEMYINDEYSILGSAGEEYIREGGEGFGVVQEPPQAILYETYYYLDGDEEQMGVYFLADGSVNVQMAPDDIRDGFYYLTENEITIMTEDMETAFLLNIQNMFTLENNDSGEVFIPVGALTKELVIDEYYYLYGVRSSTRIIFHDDGSATIEEEGVDSIQCDYSVEDGFISLIVEGTESSLEIVNDYSLDLTGFGVQFIRLK